MILSTRPTRGLGAGCEVTPNAYSGWESASASVYPSAGGPSILVQAAMVVPGCSLVRYALAVRDATKTQVADSLDPVEVPESGCGLGRAQPNHLGVGEAGEIPAGV